MTVLPIGMTPWGSRPPRPSRLTWRQRRRLKRLAAAEGARLNAALLDLAVLDERARCAEVVRSEWHSAGKSWSLKAAILNGIEHPESARVTVEE